MWDLSCPDWEDRIRNGRSLIPDLPLNEDEARMGLGFFDELSLPDVPEKPRMRHAAGQWFRDIVRASFGSWDPKAQVRHIRDILALAPKGSAKTTFGAGMTLDVMLMNRRPRAEAMFIGPTQAISDRAYEQAVGMIDDNSDLKRRFRPRDHLKTIEDLVTQSEMSVKTFDVNILTGSILIFVFLDELHLLGRFATAAKVLRQIRGGLDKTPEGLLLMTTTQSDEAPTGVFADELLLARKIRDGKYRGQVIRPMLPVLYEFPRDIASDRKKWSNPDNWPMVMPNLGRSVHMNTLIPDWNSEQEKGEHAIRIWASQHLNIEIGVGIRNDAWAGAEFWLENPKTGASNVDSTLTLKEVIRRSEVIVIGIDGGGLDDLLGVAVLGREVETGRWLLWCHAWAHEIVKERRQEIAPKLDDLAKAKELTFVQLPGDDVYQLADVVMEVEASGKLAEEDAIGVDSYGVAAIVEELTSEERGIAPERIVGIGQGWQLNGAIKTTERNLAGGTLLHDGSGLMNFAVENAKIEPRGNAISVTKQVSGSAKIDPLMAVFAAVVLMGRNPKASGNSGWNTDDLDALEAKIAAEMVRAESEEMTKLRGAGLGVY